MRTPLLFAIAVVAACAGPRAPEPAATPAPAPAPKVTTPPPKVTTPPPKVTTPAPLNPEPTKAPPAPKPKAEPAKAPAAPPVAAPPAKQAAPAMDLKVLEQRLKATDAIGVLTKLSLKNQVDDLVARFKAFHDGKRPPTLPELRPSFDLLVMKVLALLQDKDPRLASDIHASREALWSVLADRQKLLQASGE